MRNNGRNLWQGAMGCAKNLRFFILKKYLFLLSIILVSVSVLSSQFTPSIPTDWELEQQIAELGGCTSIMVGRLATTDGSVITSQSCDGNYRTWVTFESHREIPRGSQDQDL